jgi:hypothetical protein
MQVLWQPHRLEEWANHVWHHRPHGSGKCQGEQLGYGLCNDRAQQHHSLGHYGYDSVVCEHGLMEKVAWRQLGCGFYVGQLHTLVLA